MALKMYENVVLTNHNVLQFKKMFYLNLVVDVTFT